MISDAVLYSGPFLPASLGVAFGLTHVANETFASIVVCGAVNGYLATVFVCASFVPFLVLIFLGCFCAGMYWQAAATLAADLPFSARLLARSAGDGMIRLRAECGDSQACIPQGAVFNDQLRISVVEKLHIVRPVTVSNSSMLMRPRSSSIIVTNR